VPVLGWSRRRRLERDVEPVRPLVALTRRFVDGGLDAASYDRRFRRATFYANDLSTPVWEVVDAQWHACESYVDDPALRDPGDLGPEELRDAARRTLARLAGLLPALADPPPRRSFEVLHDLLEQHLPAADCLDELDALAPDGPAPGPAQVVLHPRHVLAAVDQRDIGATSDDELRAWTRAVAGRADVGRSPATADLVAEALRALTGPATPALSPDLAERLRAADRRR
jgi:hypothetical protein